MKNNIAKLYILTLVIFALAIAGYYSYVKHQEDDFSCESRFYIQNEDNLLEMDVQYNFNSGKGDVESSGYFIPNGGEPKPIKINVKFSYHKEGNDYLLTSNTTHPNYNDILMLKNALPDFFLTRNRGLNVHIYPQGQAGFVFSGDKVPYFLCLKN